MRGATSLLRPLAVAAALLALPAAAQVTTAGTVTAVPAGCEGIVVTAPYTGDSNANNTLSYRYRTPSGTGTWLGPYTRPHSASPYTFTIGGNYGSVYDVEVTYVDADGVTGTNPQTVTGILVGVPECTRVGTISGAPTGCDGIAVTAPYTGDANANNTLVYRYRTPSGIGGTWSAAYSLPHSPSPYQFTITGLTFGATYDVAVTYGDTDGTTRPNPQQINNITIGRQCTGAGTLAAAQTVGPTPSIALSATYTWDVDSDNTASYRYRVSPAGPWSSPIALPHAPSPYVATVSGLTCGATHDVELTYVDPDGIASGVPVQTVSALPVDNCVATGTPSAVVDSYSQITVQAPYTQNANGNGQAAFERRSSPVAPWASVTGCTSVTGPSPRTCVDTSVTASTTYFYRITVSDPDAVTGENPVVIGPYTTPQIDVLPVEPTGSTISAVACGQVDLGAPYVGDTNVNSTTTFSSGPSSSGPWTVVAGCAAVGGPSPHACAVTGLASTTSFFRISFADPDGVTGPATEVIGPVEIPECRVNPGKVSAVVDSCTQVTATTTYFWDWNGSSTSAFARGPSSAGPWAAVAGCGALGGPSPRTCVDLGPPEGSSVYYQVTYSDPDGVLGLNPVVSTLAARVPACPRTLTVSSGSGQPAGGNVVAGSTAVVVGQLSLSADAGSITLNRLKVASSGSALSGVDVQELLLYDDANASGAVDSGEALLAIAGWDAGQSRYVFSNLSYTVTAPLSRQVLLTLNLANGATPGRTFAVQIAQADVSVVTPHLVAAAGFPIAGNDFTVTAGSWSEGDPTPGSTRPMVILINPRNGAAVSSDGPAGATGFRVQAQVASPSDLLSVALSTDDGATFPVTMTRNPSYGRTPNDGIWETAIKLSPGTYVLRVRATNAGGPVDSAKVQIVVSPPGTGDGNLLVRDNSSQLCMDCHALKTHSSQSTSTQYGTWGVTCRDCHTPHGTPNVYLVKSQVTPPAVNGVQPARGVKFSTTTGATTSTAITDQSFANEADSSGPCQVCHTRTKSPSGVPRWRNTGNSDAHFTAAAGTQPCINCHTHAGGFAPGESNGRTDCTICHNALFSALNASTGNNHHHYLYQGWSGTTARSDITVYPTAAPTSSLTDVNRRCLMCHVDHELFRPDFNENGGRGKNLRTDITLVPTATDNFTNTDFDGALASGGICVSCHQNVMQRAYTTSAGTTTTLRLSKSEFQVSAHNYGADNPVSVFKGQATSTFVANCSKCHNDTMVKAFQLSGVPRQFSLHDSTVRSITAPLGVAAPVDPMGEVFCYQCHRRATDALAGSAPKPAAGRDYYDAAAMVPQSELLYNVFTATAYAFKHPLDTSALHRATDEGAAAADGSLSGANRHVSCADCHSPHGARSKVEAGGSGTATAFSTGTPPTHDTLTDATKAWTANQWKGFTVRIVSGTGAGQKSVIYGNTSAALSVELLTALDTTSVYQIINQGRSTTAVGYAEPVGPVAGAWGLAPDWPTPPAPPTWDNSTGCDPCAPLASQYATITTWNRVETPAADGQVCIKCHSSYAYGASPPLTPSGMPNSTDTTWSNTVGAAAVQTDKASELNPNNLAHHAVFARGKNQPLVSSDTVTSTYNLSWPRYTIGTVTATTGSPTVTLTGGTWPSTVLPGWFLYIGSTTPAQAVAGWYEVVAVPSSITLTLDRAYTGMTGSGKAFALTAGLGNTFVPPWGPWSTVQCADCHTSDTTMDPYGPHGSATKWLLRKAVPQRFAFYNGNSVVEVTNPLPSEPPLDENHFCLNCHRRDSYGDHNYLPPTGGASGYPRQRHPPDSGTRSSLAYKPKWGIICMNCHGGAQVGGIHGLNLGQGAGGAAGSYSGKRLLAGSSWYGVTRSTSTVAGQCWTKANTDAVDNCGHSHVGVTFESGVARYDYDTAL